MWPGVCVVIYLRCQKRGRWRGESERSEMQNNLNKRISWGTQSTTSVLLHLLLLSSSALLIWFHFFSFSVSLSFHAPCPPPPPPPRWKSIVWKSRGAAPRVRVDTVLITCSVRSSSLSPSLIIHLVSLQSPRCSVSSSTLNSRGELFISFCLPLIFRPRSPRKRGHAGVRLSV